MAPPPNKLRSVPAPVFPFAGKTVRERIAEGIKFELDKSADVGAQCAACGGHGEERTGVIDTKSGLGPRCWIAWRWSAIREYEIK